MNSILRYTIFLALGLILFEGCGNQETPPSMSSNSAEEMDSPSLGEPRPIVPPTVSIDAPQIQLGATEDLTVTPSKVAMSAKKSVDVVSETVPARAPKGSVEWLIQEIASLKNARQRVPETLAAADGNNDPTTKVQDVAVHSNHKIIELAQQVIVKTHDSPEQIAFFNSAVEDMADARLQLAIAGDARQAQLLSDDAAALYQKDPSSFAAAEVAFKLVQFTQVQAQSMAAKDPKWALGFARQSRLFASQFPQETNRAAIQLVAAGRICDKIGLTDQAMSCLMLVEQNYPNSPFSDQVKNTLRRLRLPGQELMEFGGSTIDGNFISIDQFRGRPVIIAFWASNSVVFREDMVRIDEIVASFGGEVHVIGVNLDREEAAVQRFITITGNNWPHIFYSDVNKRGMENLIAKYYGVTKIPSYWLVDAQGMVKSVNLKPEDLRQHLAQLALAGN